MPGVCSHHAAPISITCFSDKLTSNPPLNLLQIVRAPVEIRSTRIRKVGFARCVVLMMLASSALSTPTKPNKAEPTHTNNKLTEGTESVETLVRTGYVVCASNRYFEASQHAYALDLPC